MHPKIENLANHPELVPTLAKWRWEEWGRHDPEGSLTTWIKALEEHLSQGKIPQSLVAIIGDQPAGVASLARYDMATRKDLSPWLTGLFVPYEFRSEGIATSLVKAIELLAGKLGFKEVFLYTHSAEGLYDKLGWREIEREEYQGREVVIMSKVITT